MSTTTLDSPTQGEWVLSPRWDLTWLTLSCVLVAVPPVFHAISGTSAGTVDILITLLIGGPHMYATFLKTALEPRFRQIHPALTWAPVVVVPTLVILGAVFAFPLLLVFFFTWASLHVCDQASYIAWIYRERGGAARPWHRLLDFAAIATALYSYAMYRHVEGSFVVGDVTLPFPPFLRGQVWFAHAFALLAAGILAAWAVMTVNQLRRRELGLPYVAFMALTIGVALVITRMPNLSVAFQGFNAWHSFQYLGLTFFILQQDNAAGEVGAGFIQRMARPGRFLRFYGFNLGITAGATVVILVLTKVIALPAEPTYYAVVLSFLLVHYAHDHFLFALGSGFRPK
jgi:hypothetical protein